MTNFQYFTDRRADDELFKIEQFYKKSRMLINNIEQNISPTESIDDVKPESKQLVTGDVAYDYVTDAVNNIPKAHDINKTNDSDLITSTYLQSYTTKAINDYCSTLATPSYLISETSEGFKDITADVDTQSCINAETLIEDCEPIDQYKSTNNILTSGDLVATTEAVTTYMGDTNGPLKYLTDEYNSLEITDPKTNPQSENVIIQFLINQLSDLKDRVSELEQPQA